MKKLIILSGKSESGKTTFANCVKSELESQGYKVCITNYARHIKAYLKDFYNWDGVKTVEMRELLQRLGTDTIRNKMNKPLFHVERTCTDIEVIQEDFDYIIIDDCRFIGECYYPKAIFKEKVELIRIIRDGHISKLTPEQLMHESETALDDFNGFDMIMNIESGIRIMELYAKDYVERVVNG